MWHMQVTTGINMQINDQTASEGIEDDGSAGSLFGPYPANISGNFKGQLLIAPNIACQVVEISCA